MNKKITILLILLLMLFSACGGTTGRSDQKTISSSITSEDPRRSVSLNENVAEENDVGIPPKDGKRMTNLNIPNLSLKIIIGDYDPDSTYNITLSTMISFLGIEIDDSRTKYVYHAEDEDGKIREFDFPDGLNLDTPGIGNTYSINQYDKDGNLVEAINYQIYGNQESGKWEELYRITIYERTNTGRIRAAYHYYPDYYSECILHDYDWYYDKDVVSTTHLDEETHKRSYVTIHRTDAFKPAKDLICNSDGEFIYYITYEYNDELRPTRTSFYNMEDELQSYILYYYDEDGKIHANNYDNEGNLTGHVLDDERIHHVLF